jgi:hypothetical protein
MTGAHAPAHVIAHILTLNEEGNIAAAIRSVKQVADEVIVVDSFSSDATCDIALQEGATVWRHPFDNWAAQHNWALDRIDADYGNTWIFDLDADERVTPELAGDIRRKLLYAPPAHDVYLIKLQLTFDGRLLRHGGYSSTGLPRLYKLSAGRYERRPVNCHFAPAPSASVGKLKGAIVHEDVHSWEHHIAKHNRYSTLEAQERARVAAEGDRIKFGDAVRMPFLRRRWLRETIWNHLPARPLLRFVQLYLAAGGILDGRAGFRMAVFQAWHELCIDVKYEELMKAQQSPSGVGADS